MGVQQKAFQHEMQGAYAGVGNPRRRAGSCEQALACRMQDFEAPANTASDSSSGLATTNF